MSNAYLHKRSMAAAGAAVLVALAGQAAAGIAARAASPAGAGAGAIGATRPTAAAPAAGGPGRWSQVTPSNTPDINDIGLARGADGVLHVLWAGGANAGQGTIRDTPVGPGGTAQRPVTIASGQFLVTDPDATATPAGLDVFWNGIKTGKPNSPAGTFEATRPLRGGHWTVSAAVVPPLPAVPFTSFADSAGTGSDGKPWVAFSGTDSLVVLHQGHPEKQIPPTACCVYNSGLAADGASGATWLTYLSLITGRSGIYVQRLSATGASGPAVRLPGSETGGNVFPESQRVGITGRGRGRSGVYVLYAAGYPAPRSLDLLKLGAKTPVKLAGFSGFAETLAGDTVTAGPNGRLWATWFDGDGTPARLFVRASGANGAGWGQTVSVRLPAGTSRIFKVYTSAQAGRVDVVALLNRGRTTAYFATQVLLPPPPKKKAAAATQTAAVTAMAAAGAAASATPGAGAAKAPAWHVVKSVPATRGGGAFTAVAATGKASGWAFFGNEGSVQPQAWRWNGRAWTRASFPGKNDEEVDVAAATSPTDVWAFTNGFRGGNSADRVLHFNGRSWSVAGTFTGTIAAASVLAANDVWVFGVGNHFAAYHYNGRSWTFDGTDVDGGSALGPNDAWGYTGTFIERWPGRKWVATNLARLLPAKRSSNSPSLTGVIALSDSNVYAIGNAFSVNKGGPTVILHFNGKTWRRVAEGGFGDGPASQLGGPDGRGGLWLPMPDISALPSYLVHYLNGRLAAAALPGHATALSVAHLPGAGDELAGGYSHPAGNPQSSSAGVILEYS